MSESGYPFRYAASRGTGLEPRCSFSTSGGECKRIELAAVLAMQPRLAILEEPAAGIDLLSLDEIVGVIEALNRAGAAILLITHQENVAARAHRASQLCGGRIVAALPPG